MRRTATREEKASDGGRLRVLFVLEHFPPYVGGVETLFGNLARALVAGGHRVRVVTSRIPGTDAEETWEGVEVRRVACPRLFRRYAFSLLAFPAAFREARDADVVHTTTYNAAPPAWLAARLRGVPGVLTVHEVFGRQWHELPGVPALAGAAFRVFEELVTRLPFARWVCDSDFTRKRLLGAFPRRAAAAVTVYPAFEAGAWRAADHVPRDLRAELGLGPRADVYLFFGRPGVSKGVEYLVEAAAAVRAARPESHLLLLLGREPATRRKALLARVQELGLASHVTVREPVPHHELPGYLLGAACVVVPSVSEGFGYAALESATLGCRVVATSGHSVEEIVGPWVRLVPPRDPDALARGIVAAMGDSRPAPTPPEDAYSPEAHVSGILAIYRQLRPEGRP